MDVNQGGRPQSDREWKLLEKLLLSVHDESRKQRRWTIFFRLMTFAYLFLLLVLFLPGRSGVSVPVSGEHVGIIDVSGVIADGADASADVIVTGLREAFDAKDSKAVILRINSPGGSPVQSAYINDEITRLRAKYPEKKLYAVIQDVAASGGYYVAVAADAIYANESSLVGSVGVLMNGFGFPVLMDKLGVERRLHTAGERKGFLDPFTQEKPADVAHIKVMLDELHEQFIAVVKRGRGDKLKGDDEALFNGLIWSGKRSLDLGLIDGFGSASHVAREVIGEELIVDYTPGKGLLERVTERLGVTMGREISAALGLNPLSLR